METWICHSCVWYIHCNCYTIVNTHIISIAQCDADGQPVSITHRNHQSN